MVRGAIKIAVYGLLFTSGLIQLAAFNTWWFVGNVNLVFHEAGHVLFWPFGQFLYVLGGTIVELLVPIGITLVFIRQRNWFAAACTSWWCATALLSVAIYASDAQERALPLITGDPMSHDWWWLLRELNLLQYDNTVGGVFWFLALFILFVGGVLLTQDPQVKKLLTPYRSTL